MKTEGIALAVPFWYIVKSDALEYNRAKEISYR